jgi:Eukaryotic aspartyl protease
MSKASPGFSLDIHRPKQTLKHIDIQKEQQHLYQRQNENSLHKRGTVEVDADFNYDNYGYYANLSFGNPPQNVKLVIVATYGDTWINSPSSAYCRNTTHECAKYGTYDPSASSTSVLVGDNFAVDYYGSDTAINSEGNYYTDTVWLDDNTPIKGIQFGVANDTKISYGNFGLGYAITEAQVRVGHEQPYPNIPQAMANLGVINSNAFSLWLNDFDAGIGSILFGGVDAAKYSGELRTIGITPPTVAEADVTLPLTEIRFANQTVVTNQNFSIVLDPGYSFTWLPPNITDILYPLAGVRFGKESIAVIDCDQKYNQSMLEMAFAWPHFQVPMSELVYEVDLVSPDCLFGIQNATTFAGLGQSVLRSAYIVYDFTNNELSIAQTQFNVTTSNITEIKTGVNGVPGAVRSSVSSTSPSAESGLSVGAKIGIGIGVSLGAVFLACALGALFWSRRLHRNTTASQDAEMSRYYKAELAADEPASPLTDSSPVSPLELHSSGLSELLNVSERHELEQKDPPVELSATLPERVELEDPSTSRWLEKRRRFNDIG